MVEKNAFGGLSAPHKKTKTCFSLSMACVCSSLVFNFYLLLSLHPALKPSRTLVRSLRGKDGHGTSSAEDGVGAPMKRLAVVVPMHSGDLSETLKALDHWPTECTADTVAHVDLLIYKAEPKDEDSEKVTLPLVRDKAGKCFASTRMVYAELTKEVRVICDDGSVCIP